MKISYSNLKTIENESVLKDFNNVFMFDNLYKTAIGFESSYKALIRDIDAVLIDLIDKKDVSSVFFIELERSLFTCVNAYYQLIEHIKTSFPAKNSAPHLGLKNALSFFIENNQGFKTFTKLRNYIQHSSNIPFYVSILNGKSALLINEHVIDEDKRINYSFDKEISSGYRFDMLNLTYDFIEEASKVINYLFFIVSREVVSDVNAYITYFGNENVESNKILMAHVKKTNDQDDYYPCPQRSVIELIRIYNSECHRELYDVIDEMVAPNESESFLWMKGEFIKELGKKEGEKKYKEFLKGMTMPPHAIETWSNYLKFAPPEDAKKAKLEKIKSIRNAGLFDCIFICK